MLQLCHNFGLLVLGWRERYWGRVKWGRTGREKVTAVPFSAPSGWLVMAKLLTHFS
ncbi:MAG: hypothetical protein M5U34_12980 [Chloroflexi bacterium]|nr:hypothetical protein [Chloroflexota bacterium]